MFSLISFTHTLVFSSDLSGNNFDIINETFFASLPDVESL